MNVTQNFFAEQENTLINQAKKYLPTFRQIYATDGADALISFVYTMADKILDKSGLFEKASCNKSCSFCCHDTIMVSKLEAKFIEKGIKLYNIVPNKERKVLQRREQIRLEKANLKLTSKVDSPLKFMGRACPMLADADENGHRKCTIYEFRPLVCRTHNSLEDPKFCNKEEYPNRTIGEGRIVEAEALNFALLMLEAELGINGKFPHMDFLHNM